MDADTGFLSRESSSSESDESGEGSEEEKPVVGLVPKKPVKNFPPPVSQLQQDLHLSDSSGDED